MIFNQYEQLEDFVFKNGVPKSDRTGTGTRSVFGYQMRFNLAEGFPLVTTKKLHLRSIIHELLWFLKGESNIAYLRENKVTIWDEWADENGELGPVYGVQWRSWPTADGKTVDQIANVIQQIKTNPDSRRLVVSAWNVGEVPKCICLRVICFSSFTLLKGACPVSFTKEAATFFLGVPFNIASYSLLTHMVAQQCDLKVGDFVWTGGDCHIYDNHIEQVKEQLSRSPREAPQLVIKRKPDSIFDYKFEDFEIVGYDPYPAIKAPVAV